MKEPGKFLAIPQIVELIGGLTDTQNLGIAPAGYLWCRWSKTHADDFCEFNQEFVMSETITKTALIESLAEKTGISKSKASEFVSAFISEIQDNVTNGNTVNITGFGSFTGKARAARDGRNPKTGETIKIAAAVVPTFKAGSAFKAAVAK